MKTYHSHKTVQAAKIVAVTINPDGSAILSLQGDKTQTHETVDSFWVRKNTPQGKGPFELCGGYFVRYSDGYTSWSPAHAFEEGHTEHSLDPKDGALPVAGYKPQTDGKVKLVNGFKYDEERILRKLDELKDHGGIDQRWLAIGRTQLEQAFMAVNRSVFKPGRVELPEDANTLPPSAA